MPNLIPAWPGQRFVVWTIFLLSQCVTGWAAIPAPEKLLPDDTLVLVTAPDLTKASQAWQHSPYARLWADPALHAFKEHFIAQWNEDLVQPLERELQIKLSDYTSLLQGQLTFAVTRNGWQGGGDPPPGWLLLLDVRDKTAQLKTALADARKKWTAAGKTVRLEKIRDLEFAVLSMSSNDVPRTLRKLMPKSSDVEEIGEEEQPKPAAARNELYLGRVDSLLIVGNAARPVEKIVARLTGGTLPALADAAEYQANPEVLFREAPLYAWVNVKGLLDAWLRKAAEKKDNPEAPNPFDIKPEKIVNAVGLASLSSLGASFRSAGDGEFFQVFAAVPEAKRQGLFTILAGEPKQLPPPPFVPADAIKYRRWRVDGQKAWATLEKVLGDISPQWLSGVNFLLETANTAAKEKDPGFDIRKNLIGNLGDDIVYYEKAARAGALRQTGPGLLLIASPNPEQLAAALKSVLVFFSQEPGTPPEQREFLGRKIFSAPLTGMALPLAGGSAPSSPRTLHYAASGGYVALSSDAATLEEYLRNCDGQGKALRDAPGLSEAMQKVTGPGASWFGYENDVESFRSTFETLRNIGPNTNSASGSAFGATAAPGLAGTPGTIQDWLDFSLLPPFEQVAKYFSFTVYGCCATTEGLTFKLFVPAPTTIRSTAVN